MPTNHRLDAPYRVARRDRPRSDFLQTPWREYPGCSGRGQVPVLGPGTTNHGEAHTGIGLEFLPVGNQLELVEARRIRGSRREGIDEDAVTAPVELLRPVKSRR